MKSKLESLNTRTLAILTLSALILFCASVFAADDAITVKFEQLKSGHIAVPVKINGQGPFRLGFDTGSPPTFVSTKVQRELGLRGQAGRQMGAMMMPGAAITVELFEVGGLKSENFPIMVNDHPTVKMLSDAQGGMEGLIGFNFFTRYHTTIDYEKQELVFKPLSQAPRIGPMGAPRRPTIAPTRAVVFGAETEVSAHPKGVRVTAVIAGSAADEAGLKRGDVITSLNDRWVTGAGDLAEALSAIAPALPARIKIIRDNKEHQLTVKARAGL